MTHRTIVIDTEANSLRPDKVHCVVCKDENTGEFFEWKQEECYNEFPKWYKENVKILIGHNIIGFDIPFVLTSLLGVDVSSTRIYDTLVLSRLFNTNRHFAEIAKIKNSGGVAPQAISKRPHSLEAWGIRTGLGKPDHTDWSVYSEAMLRRCKYDVEINSRTWKKLKSEANGFSSDCISLEQDVTEIIFNQQKNGFYLDQAKALRLRADCKVICDRVEEDIQPDFPPKKKLIKVFTPRVTAKGDIHGQDKKTIENNLSEWNEDGTVSVYKMIPFNLRSPVQVTEKLEEAGWRPINFNKPSPKMIKEGKKQGSAKISDEQNLATIPDTAPQGIKQVGKFLVMANRVSMVDQWFRALNNVDKEGKPLDNGKIPDDRVHGFVNVQGTITGRMTHSGPNMANVPHVATTERKDVLGNAVIDLRTGEPFEDPILGEAGGFGYESRECWTVDDLINKCLVGCDASGLELRMLAHYMNDEAYTDDVVNGDIHSRNMTAFGLTERSLAKTVIYALLYGAGDALLGFHVGGTAKDGAELRRNFEEAVPAYAKLRRVIGNMAKKRGFIMGLDGRKILSRSEHSALNFLLQGAGAIVMKRALVIANELLRTAKLWNLDVNNIHDEFQKEVYRKDADKIGELCVKSIVDAGLYYNMNCPLDANYMVGNSWASTH